MHKPDVKQILDLMIKEFGNREFKPHNDPIAELVQTILSQNTSDLNSRPAFKSLITAFGTWEKIILANPDSIAESIKSGGLARIKALRIQKALSDIQQRRGQLELRFLQNMPVPEAREWLMKLPGVGYKTANCVLLFALGKPALPVDTHVFRVSKRLGLIRQKASFEEANIVLEPLIPPASIYEFHVLMIEHGRHICTARKPGCLKCLLKIICPAKVV